MTDFVCQNCGTIIKTDDRSCPVCCPEQYEWEALRLFCPWRKERDCKASTELCSFADCAPNYWRSHES